jgi:hypothetical protein
VVPTVVEEVHALAQNHQMNSRKYTAPFVDGHQHLNRRWFVLVFDLSLEVGNEPIREQTYQQEQYS